MHGTRRIKEKLASENKFVGLIGHMTVATNMRETVDLLPVNWTIMVA